MGSYDVEIDALVRANGDSDLVPKEFEIMLDNALEAAVSQYKSIILYIYANIHCHLEIKTEKAINKISCK